jgi:hypothetical protein
MKFIGNNKSLIILILLTIFNLFNKIQLKQISNLKKIEDNVVLNKNDFPTVAPLSKELALSVENGNKFCASNCVIDENSSRIRTCLFENKALKCRKCTNNPLSKPDNSINMICKRFCNGILPSQPCNFYGYFSGKLKEKINFELLKKFNLKLLK